MLHLAARVHALAHGLFRPSDRQVARALYDEVAALRTRQGIASDEGHVAFVVRVSRAAAARLDRQLTDQELTTLAIVLNRMLAYEDLFALPEIDWSEPHSVSEYWTLRDALRVVRDRLKRFDAVEGELVATLAACADAIQCALPSVAGTSGAILLSTQKVHAIARVGEVVEAVCRTVDADDDADTALLPRHVRRLRRNLALASGGNPDDRAASLDHPSCRRRRRSATRRHSSRRISQARRSPTCSRAMSRWRFPRPPALSITTSSPAPATGRRRRCSI